MFFRQKPGSHPQIHHPLHVPGRPYLQPAKDLFVTQKKAPAKRRFSQGVD